MTSETPGEQVEAVKSAAQAQPPASTQNAEPRLQAPQPVPQTDAATLASAEAIYFNHEAWRDTLHELQQNRETLARVTTGFVLEREWNLASRTADEYVRADDAVKEHLGLLPSRKAQNDAD